MADEVISFKIEKHIGTLANYPTGWNKELNVVSWNDGAPKYDIRDWSEDHERMNRGVTLHPQEMQKLVDLMRERNINNDFPNKNDPDWER